MIPIARSMKILLDTNIIILDPTLLAKKHEGVSLIVPFPVRLELATTSFVREGVSSIAALLDSAVKQNLVQIYRLKTIPSIDTSERLSGTDIELITAVQELHAKGEDVRLATQDRVLIRVAASLGITVIDLTQLRKILSTEAELDKKLESEAKRILSSQTRTLLIGILGGILSNIVALAIWANRSFIVAKIPIWGTFALVLLSGLVLYTLRGRFRLQYGVFEFIFGVVLATKVFWPDFDYAKLKPTDILQALAGVYVMVRGLDNIGHALKGSRFALYWSKFSGEGKRRGVNH